MDKDLKRLIVLPWTMTETLDMSATKVSPEKCGFSTLPRAPRSEHQSQEEVPI